MPRPSSLSFWAAYEYLATTHLDRMSLADQNTLAGLGGSPHRLLTPKDSRSLDALWDRVVGAGEWVEPSFAAAAADFRIGLMVDAGIKTKHPNQLPRNGRQSFPCV
jgi:hypothetical protein